MGLEQKRQWSGWLEERPEPESGEPMPASEASAAADVMASGALTESGLRSTTGAAPERAEVHMTGSDLRSA